MGYRRTVANGQATGGRGIRYLSVPHLTLPSASTTIGDMMERLATKILGMIDDVRLTPHDIEYLGWQMVYQSPKPMQKRLAVLADSLMMNQAKINEECEGQDGLWN